VRILVWRCTLSWPSGGADRGGGAGGGGGVRGERWELGAPPALHRLGKGWVTAGCAKQAVVSQTRRAADTRGKEDEREWSNCGTITGFTRCRGGAGHTSKLCGCCTDSGLRKEKPTGTMPFASLGDSGAEVRPSNAERGGSGSGTLMRLSTKRAQPASGKRVAGWPPGPHRERTKRRAEDSPETSVWGGRVGWERRGKRRKERSGCQKYESTRGRWESLGGRKGKWVVLWGYGEGRSIRQGARIGNGWKSHGVAGGLKPLYVTFGMPLSQLGGDQGKQAGSEKYKALSKKKAQECGWVKLGRRRTEAAGGILVFASNDHPSYPPLNTSKGRI